MNNHPIGELVGQQTTEHIKHRFLDVEEVIGHSYNPNTELEMKGKILLYHNAENYNDCLPFDVWKDSLNNRVIIAVRGTSLNIMSVNTSCNSISEIVELRLDKENYTSEESFSVKKNAFRFALKIRDLIFNFVHQHVTYSEEEYSIVFTGHSLGGGMASLLCLLWTDKYHRIYESKEIGEPPHMEVLAIASISVGDEGLCKWCQTSDSPLFTHVICAFDFAPAWFAGDLKPLGKIFTIYEGKLYQTQTAANVSLGVNSFKKHKYTYIFTEMKKLC